MRDPGVGGRAMITGFGEPGLIDFDRVWLLVPTQGIVFT